jgi:phosphopantothenoylcysteine decarboxylase/phosphopantothenate--cysteine ligase
MAEPQEILTYIQSLLHTGGKRDLAGENVLISAGGTREYIDPVRFIGNPSTGKMGLALAQAAMHRGAKVRLVHGLASWEVPLGVEAIPVVSAESMGAAMKSHLQDANIIIMSAAVADVKPKDYSTQKLPKRSLPSSLPLEPVPDIIAQLAQLKQPSQLLVGFAAQTGDIITPARAKLQYKNLDVIVANPIDQPESGFASDNNQAVFLDKQGNQVEIPLGSKLQVAHCLFDFLGLFHPEALRRKE